MNKLNIAGFPDGYREIAQKELLDTEIFVSPSGVRIFKADGTELDRKKYQWLTSVIRANNGDGQYTGIEIGETKTGEPFQPSRDNISDVSREYWDKRSGRVSDEQAIAALNDGSVWANRRPAA